MLLLERCPQMNNNKQYQIKCNECGKFIPRNDIINNTAKYKFVPDSQFGPEKSYWVCQRCS